MKLHSLTIENFRSIKGRIDVRLDAPIVLIHGANGAGKTSLLTALEIALTGKSAALSRIDNYYQKYLLHQGTRVGRIELSADESAKPAAITISTDGIKGAKLLSTEKTSFFNERCYLAQSTLSKLLEIYERQDTKRSDTPLTAFVKELLGLDQLDALIDGVHPVGHISRLRALVPEYRDVERDFDQIKTEHLRLNSSLEEQQTLLSELKDGFRSFLQASNQSLLEIIDDYAAIEKELDLAKEEKELTVLNQARINLSAYKQQLAEILTVLAQEEEKTAEQEEKLAKKMLAEWDVKTGIALKNLLDKVQKYFPDMKSAVHPHPESARSRANQIIKTELERCESQLRQSNLEKKKKEELDQEIIRIEARGKTLDKQISEIAQNTDGLSRVLADSLQYISGNICPTCDRDFGEISEKALSEYISHKVTAMQEAAGRLKILSKEKMTLTNSLSTLKREQAHLVAQQNPTTELNNLKTKQADLTEFLGQLTALESETIAGTDIILRSSKATERLVNIRAQNQRAVIIRNAINEMCSSLKEEKIAEEESTSDALQKLQKAIEKREETLQKKMHSYSGTKKALDELKKLNQNIAENQKELKKLEALKKQYDDIFKTVEKFKTEAKELGKKSQEVRTDIVRQVFKGSLNKVWQDFFIRLAPDELFVPAFALPENSSGPVEAVLETNYRSGGRGGNPRTMLSAGNLNTAALTLFFALHFSVRSTLPWLVIDDPLQSMDEIHIAQFAALLRTISKQNGRQVIIAVHEKTLFEYLSLELNPSSPGDKLITIELGRAADGNSLAESKQISYRKDPAIAI